MVLEAPPGPHDGFLTWYSITYEQRNAETDPNYQDLFVPDLTGEIGPCERPGDPTSCPNLNHKGLNLTSVGVEPTSGPLANLERVGVVPNPYRAHEAWDRPGVNELHFINLPPHARVLVYTVAGDLVVELKHEDPVRDFERWNLKNNDGRDVASGIYLFRVESGSFSFQNRFVVIR